MDCTGLLIDAVALVQNVAFRNREVVIDEEARRATTSSSISAAACAHGHGCDDMTCSWVRFSSSRFLDKLDHHFRPFGYVQFFDARIDLS